MVNFFLIFGRNYKITFSICNIIIPTNKRIAFYHGSFWIYNFFIMNNLLDCNKITKLRLKTYHMGYFLIKGYNSYVFTNILNVLVPLHKMIAFKGRRIRVCNHIMIIYLLWLNYLTKLSFKFYSINLFFINCFNHKIISNLFNILIPSYKSIAFHFCWLGIYQFFIFLISLF